MLTVTKFIIVKENIARISKYSHIQNPTVKGDVFIIGPFPIDIYGNFCYTSTYYNDRLMYWLSTEKLIKFHKENILIILELKQEK